MSEARTLRLEEDVHDIKAAIGRLEPLIISINATLPHLATKEELADLRGEMRTALASKPSHAYLWGVMGAMVGGQAVILAAAALALVILQTRPASTPGPYASVRPSGIVLAADSFDWDRYHDRQDACTELGEAQLACATYGLVTCDQALIDRLQRQCSAFGPSGQRKVGSDHTR
jgi:hypothetical protein